jgi:hypothetical protein
MRWMQCVFLALITLSLSDSARAQCANARELSCGVYSACFERYCPCEKTEFGYFMRYGKRYCDRFLASTGWSEKGNKWRDKTLLCLQERIVPRLSITDPPSCDCKVMKDLAFRTHVDCYTQPGASVCELEFSDYRKIYDIIDVGADIFKDAYGRRQMREVLEICRDSQKATLPSGVLDLVIKIIDKLQ